MTAPLTDVMKRLEAQAGDDDVLAEALTFLAEWRDGPDDPFAHLDPGPRVAARLVNQRRARARALTADAGALDSAELVDAISSISDRRGVDRRRARGQLIGWRSGRRTLHPAWQIDIARGDTRPGLPQVLAALQEVAPDPRDADALMTVHRPDLDGRTLADLFAEGKVATVVRLITQAADQS